MSTPSIRTYVLLLVLVASTPLVVAVAWDLHDDLGQADTHSRMSLRTLTSAMVSNTSAHLADARLSLERLAAERFSSQVDPADCEQALHDLTLGHPHYREVFTTGPEDAVRCTSTGKTKSVATLPWFQDFLAARTFHVSSPFSYEGHQVAVLSLPLWGPRWRGAVHLMVGIEAFDPGIPTQFLPQESRYGFFAADGVMVWRNSDPERVIGTRPNAAAAREIVRVRDGEFEEVAIDGVTRLFSVQPMASTGWVAFVGVPSSTVSASARLNARRSALAAFLAIGALLFLAVTVARRIDRPIADLERVARAVQHGDFSIKARVDGPRDIAEVARALNAMVDARERSEEELKAFLENSAIIAWLKDEEGRLVFVSRNYLTRFCLTRERVLGKTDEEIWPAALAARFRHGDQQLLAGQGPTEVVEQLTNPDGTPSWWLTNKFLFTGTNGRRLLGGLSVEVTAIELAERARRVSDALLDKAFGSSPIGMAIVALDGHYQRVNRAFCSMLGRTEAELLTMRFHEVSAPAELPRDLEKVAELTAGGGGETYQTEKRYLHQDGHEIWAQLNVSVVRDADGKPTHNVAQIQDISERKAAEESARLAVVGTLAAGAAHEINNPLTYVLGNLSWVEEELRALRSVIPDERRQGLDELTEAISEAHGGARRIADIISGLKTFARKPEVPVGPTDVGKVMESALQLTNAQRRNQAVTVSRISATALVLASARQLEQVFINLLVNAAQAIPEGDAAASHRITVTVRPGADGEVVAEVQDTGAGITDEVRPHLFEPFFTTKAVGAGTGLGLHTCHGIITSFGGRIEVDSQPGLGTTFRVTLAGLPGETSTPTSPVPEHLCTLPTGHRVLVVDDDASVAQAIARSLRGGPEVVTVQDARAALSQLARGEHYDLVVCDLMMPSLSGEDFQKQLRPLRPALAASMIFVTGGAFTASAAAFLAATQNRWLQKPVDTNALRRLAAERLAGL